MGCHTLPSLFPPSWTHVFTFRTPQAKESEWLCEARPPDGGRQVPALSHCPANGQAGIWLAGTAVSLANEMLLTEITNRSI